jgi:hypothetical protein
LKLVKSQEAYLVAIIHFTWYAWTSGLSRTIRVLFADRMCSFFRGIIVFISMVRCKCCIINCLYAKFYFSRKWDDAFVQLTFSYLYHSVIYSNNVSTILVGKTKCLVVMFWIEIDNKVFSYLKLFLVNRVLCPWNCTMVYQLTI